MLIYQQARNPQTFDEHPNGGGRLMVPVSWYRQESLFCWAGSSQLLTWMSSSLQFPMWLYMLHACRPEEALPCTWPPIQIESFHGTPEKEQYSSGQPVRVFCPVIDCSFPEFWSKLCCFDITSVKSVVERSLRVFFSSLRMCKCVALFCFFCELPPVEIKDMTLEGWVCLKLITRAPWWMSLLLFTVVFLVCEWAVRIAST